MVHSKDSIENNFSIASKLFAVPLLGLLSLLHSGVFPIFLLPKCDYMLLFLKKKYFRSSPVHLIATSKSLHSYARPPPGLSESDSGFSKHHIDETPVRHERVSYIYLTKWRPEKNVFEAEIAS